MPSSPSLTSYLIFTILREKKITSNNIATAIFAFSIVNVFGLINEFIEYLMRTSIFYISTEQYLIQFSAFYTDTIYDLITNFAAAFLTLVIISIFTKNNE